MTLDLATQLPHVAIPLTLDERFGHATDGRESRIIRL
jgi:hypothetical protein